MSEAAYIKKDKNDYSDEREDKRIILDSNIIISLGIYGFFQLGGVLFYNQSAGSGKF